MNNAASNREFRLKDLAVLLPGARLFSGLVLFFYLATHLFNHMMGLVSLDAMEEAGRYFRYFWRLPVIGWLLYASLAIHVAASLALLFGRRSYRMNAREWGQLIAGLGIPLFMVTHVMGTRYANFVYELNDSYTYVLYSMYVASPLKAWINAAGLIVAWLHGCIGVHFWLRFKSFYSQNFQSWGLALAVFVPIVSLAGVLSAGRDVARFSLTGEWLGPFFESLNITDDSVGATIVGLSDTIRILIVLGLVLFILLRLSTAWLSHRNDSIAVEYLGGPKIRARKGASLLEISKTSDVPHANICGGRGRCSTCRVQILKGGETLLFPSENERRVLERVNAPDDVRLACQIIPTDDLSVLRMLPADTSLSFASQLEPWAHGRERVTTVLFADLRNFTRTAEAKLPFDVVYLINQFSREMGEAVEQKHGRVDKFLGDGLMALFGIDSGPAEGARQALLAAGEMQRRLDGLNERLKADLDAPLRMGIGVHSGPAVIGRMGYGAARTLTAIGDTVNTASRLEDETKTHNCVLCVSQKTVELADITLPQSEPNTISLRGRRAKLAVHSVSAEGTRELVKLERKVRSRNNQEMVA